MIEPSAMSAPVSVPSATFAPVTASSATGAESAVVGVGRRVGRGRVGRGGNRAELGDVKVAAGERMVGDLAGGHRILAELGRPDAVLGQLDGGVACAAERDEKGQRGDDVGVGEDGVNAAHVRSVNDRAA